MHKTKQTTLKAPFRIMGKGVHSGVLTNISVMPARENTGYVYKRVDLTNQPVFAVNPENILATDRNTTIGLNEQAKVMTGEHLLSALWAMGVDNAEIEINGMEMPIFDGSAKLFCEQIQRSGIDELDTPRQIRRLSKPVASRCLHHGGIALQWI